MAEETRSPQQLNDYLYDQVNIVTQLVRNKCIHCKKWDHIFHLEHLWHVLETLRREQYHAKLKKCESMKSEMPFLGHVVSAAGVRVDPQKVIAVRDWPVFTSVTQVRSFLGLTNYFRKFMQGYASMRVPLTDLTRKHARFVWDEKVQAAFGKIKESLLRAPVLKHPDFSKPFEVVPDASDFGVGAVLLQDGHLACESAKLKGPQLEWTVPEKGLFGVVHAFSTWRCYLEGAQGVTTVVTDHMPNTWRRSQRCQGCRPCGQLSYRDSGL